MGTTWHFQKLNCIYKYRSVWKHSAKHSASAYRTIQLQVDRRWLSSVRCGTWQVTLERDNPPDIQMGPRDVTQAPISQSVLPGMSTKTSQYIPNLSLDKLCIGYNWLVGPLWICIFPRWYWRLTGAKDETAGLFFHTHKYAYLIHWGRVTHICVSKLGHYWLR